jgi:DtxR family Mn-dependent transcriptional regulator
MKKRTIEEYVEVIYKIQEKKQMVHTNDVALSMNVNPASVTEMFQKLTNEGFLNYEKYNGVRLTDKGMSLAIMLKKRHETLRHFLEIIGVDKKIANADACKIEHNVNPLTIKKLRTFVEYAQRENVCTRWLDHFKYYDETGKFIICNPSNENNCPIHGKNK